MKKAVLISACALALGGCASIFNGSSQTLTINSEPDGADLVVSNRAGDKIHTGTTPATISVKRGAGYFKSETYLVTLNKPGFETQEFTVTSSVSGWYIGNIIFGGLIGFLAVDPATGAMYTFPDSVSQKLVAKPESAASGTQSLTIVSTATLSAEQMRLAQPIGNVHQR